MKLVKPLLFAAILSYLLPTSNALPNTIYNNIQPSAAQINQKIPLEEMISKQSTLFSKQFYNSLSTKLPANIVETISKEQIITINLSEYKLKLHTKGNYEPFEIPIAIGKGIGRKNKTPEAVGILYNKRYNINFRYGSSYPHLGIKAGDVIKWTNTYAEDGKPTGYIMPYKKMRGIGMKLWTSKNSQPKIRYVIHSTSDEYTVGLFDSSGCIRVQIDDMLKLYKNIEPNLKRGNIQRPVPIIIDYTTMEIVENTVKLHADIYDKNHDNYALFIKQMLQREDGLSDINLTKVKEQFNMAQSQFDDAIDEILKIRKNNFPNHYIDQLLKDRLHIEFPLKTFR